MSNSNFNLPNRQSIPDGEFAPRGRAGDVSETNRDLTERQRDEISHTAEELVEEMLRLLEALETALHPNIYSQHVDSDVIDRLPVDETQRRLESILVQIKDLTADLSQTEP